GTASGSGARRSDRPRGGSAPSLPASRPYRSCAMLSPPRVPGDIRKIVRKIVSKAKVVTKATRKPRRGQWPPDPARVRSIIDGLEELYPDVDCELDRESPFQLVCATILSAQSTDKRVNMVTPELLRRYPTPEAMAKAPLPALEKIIRSTGFFRMKAKSIKGAD